MAKARSSHPSAAGDYRWRKVKAKHKALCRARNAPCALCIARGDYEMAAIDYSAPPLSPRGFESDHIRPYSARPDLFYILENLQASHVRCNRMRRDAIQSSLHIDRSNPVSARPAWEIPDW